MWKAEAKQGKQTIYPAKTVKHTQLKWPDSFLFLLWCNTVLFLHVMKLAFSQWRKKKCQLGADCGRFRPTGLSDVDFLFPFFFSIFPQHPIQYFTQSSELLFAITVLEAEIIQKDIRNGFGISTPFGWFWISGSLVHRHDSLLLWATFPPDYPPPGGIYSWVKITPCKTLGIKKCIGAKMDVLTLSHLDCFTPIQFPRSMYFLLAQLFNNCQFLCLKWVCLTTNIILKMW